MSERRSNRGRKPRTDREILASHDMVLIRAVRDGILTKASGCAGSSWMLADEPVRMDLRRLAREDVLLVGFAGTASPTLLPRGVRLLEAARGEFSLPMDE